jgi:flagellar motor switch protein FliN
MNSGRNRSPSSTDDPMSEALPRFADDVLAACRLGADEAGAALTRAFQDEVKVTLGQKSTLQSAAPELDLQSDGLIVLLKTDRTAVVVTIPAAKRLVPAWCATPDPTGASKLGTLAQELGMNLLPESWIAQDFRAGWVGNLGETLGRGGVPRDAVVVPLAVTVGGRPAGTLGVLWPAANPDRLFADPAAETIAPAESRQPAVLPRSSGDLPPYTRSLLRITVPVVVTLAEKRQKLSRIIDLGPGSIIQFDKSCEEMLELEIGSHTVAAGEAVKVGDKFGLRITSMVLPDERFVPVKRSDARKTT